MTETGFQLRKGPQPFKSNHARGEIKASLKASGQKVPVLCTRSGIIYDGNTRFEILTEDLDLPVQAVKFVVDEDVEDTEAGAYKEALRINLNRRQLTRAEKREMIQEYLARTRAEGGGGDQVAVAELFGVSQSTVSRIETPPVRAARRSEPETPPAVQDEPAAPSAPSVPRATAQPGTLASDAAMEALKQQLSGRGAPSETEPAAQAGTAPLEQIRPGWVSVSIEEDALDFIANRYDGPLEFDADDAARVTIDGYDYLIERRKALPDWARAYEVDDLPADTKMADIRAAAKLIHVDFDVHDTKAVLLAAVNGQRAKLRALALPWVKGHLAGALAAILEAAESGELDRDDAARIVAARWDLRPGDRLQYDDGRLFREAAPSETGPKPKRRTAAVVRAG
jgi:hypothetical protein